MAFPVYSPGYDSSHTRTATETTVQRASTGQGTQRWEQHSGDGRGERTLWQRFSDTSDLNRDWMMAAPPSLVVMSWEIGSLLLFVKSGGWKVA